MLTTGLQFPASQQQYLSALNAHGNMRSSAVQQRSPPQGLVSVNLLTADCKVMQLHEKRGCPPEVTMRYSKPTLGTLNTSASVLSVYATRPVAITRTASHPVTTGPPHRSKKRSSSVHNKPLLQKRTNSSPSRSVDASCVVRRSVTGVNASGGGALVNTGDKKATKVYLSQKQSASVKDCGVLVPGAPPATPTPDHLKLYDYVPSLADVKAQRHMRQRLEGMSKSDQRAADRKREQQMVAEKHTYKEKVIERKRRQRQEIYALNKVMTELEYKGYEEMLKTKGLNE